MPEPTTTDPAANLPLPAPKSDFIGLRGKIHLATGGEPPMLVAHRMSFEEFARDKAAGYEGYHRHWQVAEVVREQLAALFSLTAAQIALLGNASDGIGRVVGSIDWRSGDNVVVSELDYASGRFALASLRQRGVELRLVPARDWLIHSGDLLNQCDKNTRLVYLSQVTSLTGQHTDIAPLSQQLKGSGTALLLDASHALGAVPVRSDLADFTVASCYKFALAIHDGVLAWNHQRWPDFEPAEAGWWSAEPGADGGSYQLKAGARRAEYGNANHLGTYILRESLSYLAQYGITAIAGHIRFLSGLLVEGMRDLELNVITPQPQQQRAGSAAFQTDDNNFVQRAAAANILLWGDSGRVRASAHLFTSEREVREFLSRLPTLLRR